MHPRSPLLGLALAALLLGSCAATRWDGDLEHSGSLDLVTRPLGVSLMKATNADSYGLGVLESAAGVFVVLDGQVALGRALSATHARTDPGFAPGMGASWIVRADVPKWTETRLHEPVDFDGLALRVAELARKEGWPADRPLLFLVEGPLEAVSASILRGAPPTGSAPTGAGAAGSEPFRTSLRSASGTLVGVLAPGGTGVFVLPGDSLRVHAFLREPTHLVATLDAARILAGARLRIPAR